MSELFTYFKYFQNPLLFLFFLLNLLYIFIFEHVHDLGHHVLLSDYFTDLETFILPTFRIISYLKVLMFLVYLLLIIFLAISRYSSKTGAIA